MLRLAQPARSAQQGDYQLISETMPEQKIGLDGNMYSLSNMQIAMHDEGIRFLLITGNQARQYEATPEHAKRISMLLQKNIEAYEEKNGEIETKLPEGLDKETGEESNLGFHPNE